jgi:hypothetical protein
MCKAEKIATENMEQPALFPRAAEGLLRNGQPIRFKAAGNSMHPTIRQGDTLIVEPCNPTLLAVGDIVLFKDAGRLFAHRIIRITHAASRAGSPLLKFRLWLDAPKAEIPARGSSMGASQVQRSAKGEGLRFVLRGDFRSTADAPIRASQILGKVVAVDRNQKIRSPYGYGKQFFARTYRFSSRLKSILSF